MVASLKGRFSFAPKSPDATGLRRPQLGALHAILADRSTESTEPITIVMPTGTGKTETMLAYFAHSPVRTLVVVPSDALRTQIAKKFISFGVLPAVGVLNEGFFCPVVSTVRSALRTAAQVDDVVAPANVIVATAASIASATDEARNRLIELCDQLLVDEAHHVAARTWRTIAESFGGKPVIQFTATPYREDGQHLGSRIAYAYPLHLAQQHKWFARINYHSISDLANPDRAVATAAIDQLRADLARGLDHVLMARVNSIGRAQQVLDLYAELAPELNPIRLDSKMGVTRRRIGHTALEERSSRVVVCVDMLGEGFDLPALKVAAVHDPHKSLAVTLQFVGRFARVGDETLGDASVFLPRPAGDIDDRLRKLYGEDTDWNSVIVDLSESAVGREKDRSEFEAAFDSVPTEISLKNLQPKMSTVVYESPDLQWDPEAVYDLFEGRLLTQRIGINTKDHVAWWVTEAKTPVRWGDFSTFGELIHELYVVHADMERGLLYVNCSDTSSVHREVARAIGGDEVSIIKGDIVYRVLHPIARRVPTNVGVLDAVNRNRRFSMHVGTDVLEGFGPTAAQKSKTNIFAHGYAGGTRVSVGASRKGRIWSHKVAYALLDWVKWAKTIGTVITDDLISVESVMAGFIIPVAATERPDLVALGIEWPYNLIGNTSETRQVEVDGIAHPLLDLDIALTNWDSIGPIPFEVRSDDWSVGYEMTFGTNGPETHAVGRDATIQLAKGAVPLGEFLTDAGLTVFFEKEAVLSPDGYLIQPNRERARFASDLLEPIDWSGVDIAKESQGPTRDQDSVQFRVVETLDAETDWELIIDDDGRGELADVVCVRRDTRTLHILLAHCKYSQGRRPGARLADLYEVCGQAVKSHKARSEAELMLRKLLRRERGRAAKGRSGFIKGDAAALVSIINEARLLDVEVAVVIAQPGLSKAAFTNPLAELLGCTELYLNQTYNSSLRVLCST